MGILSFGATAILLRASLRPSRPGRFRRCFPLSNFYAMKHGGNVSTHTISQLCRLLQCRVQDVMEYIDEE